MYYFRLGFYPSSSQYVTKVLYFKGTEKRFSSVDFQPFLAQPPEDLKEGSQWTSGKSQETIGESTPTGGNRKIMSFRVMYLSIASR